MQDNATRPLTPEERHELLRLARESVTAAVEGGPPPAARLLTPALAAPGGAFVTLHRNGKLRGCIGSVVARTPLWQTVVDMAEAAATRDPRFPPVTREELPEIDIEISRLTPPVAVRPEDVVPGRHGLLIVRGSFRGLLLPQVARRYGWSREEFLAETCMKAALPPDAWQRPGTEIYAFEAEVFGESPDDDL